MAQMPSIRNVEKSLCLDGRHDMFPENQVFSQDQAFNPSTIAIEALGSARDLQVRISEQCCTCCGRHVRVESQVASSFLPSSQGSATAFPTASPSSTTTPRRNLAICRYSFDKTLIIVRVP
ncbi:hypothetical protein HBH98_184030 [Parastagonospora nodorum]|nr:hypothetical protein HBH51_162210 [Parastagonospora nodorum]KAH4107899.1 hypothetical protein HBH46_053830 [Parastagonospora nodorum]KAH4176456.1 hypothetical protein HBH43_058810 [Parastagonospora nodorum]KAH4196011.1 hypothetical protein HBH42_080300 [Parastagonospora nodorum]KAH4205033.1 hypothetical protein HBI95_142810 [Parastagonospora nodorum]